MRRSPNQGAPKCSRQQALGCHCRLDRSIEPAFEGTRRTRLQDAISGCPTGLGARCSGYHGRVGCIDVTGNVGAAPHRSAQEGRGHGCCFR